MDKKLSYEEGIFCVKFARDNIIEYLNNRTTLLDKININTLSAVFKEYRGVFTTLNTYSPHNLRGCIGIPEPIMPLINALSQSSISAAVEDPRFPPVSLNEINNIVVEVSILTPPKQIIVNNPIEYLDNIVIGRDGLIIEYGLYRGLLLPQVPKEYNWSVEEYLDQICLKAGLPPKTWLDEKVKLYSFEAQIFKELTPNGKVVEE